MMAHLFEQESWAAVRTALGMLVQGYTVAWSASGREHFQEVGMSWLCCMAEPVGGFTTASLQELIPSAVEI